MRNRTKFSITLRDYIFLEFTKTLINKKNVDRKSVIEDLGTPFKSKFLLKKQ